MITYILIFVVATLATGLAVQGYEDFLLQVEFAGYHIEASMTFIVFVACAVTLLLVLLIRLILMCAVFTYKMRCRSVMKKYDELGTGYAFLSLGKIEDVKQVVGIADRLGDQFHHSSFTLLVGCACFKLGQYEIAEQYFSHVSKNASAMLNEGVGLWLFEILEQEKSRDCRLRVLSRLESIFCKKPWAVIFRVDILRIEGKWNAVLSELKFAAKHDVTLPYSSERMHGIARYMLAKECYYNAEYKAGLKLMEKVLTIQMAVLKAKMYVKLGNEKRALEVLEAQYVIGPHPEIATLYLELVRNRDVAVGKLSSLNPEHYVSLALRIKRYINVRQYNAAEQYVKRALVRYKYVELYCLMLDVMARLGNVDEVLCWVDKMQKDSTPNMRWECRACRVALQEWRHECGACGKFDAVEWVE